MCISHLLRVLTVQVSTLLRLYLFLDPKLMTECYRNKHETLTFACPDSSDIDEGYDVSEEDKVEGPSSDDGVSMGSPQAKASHTVSAIDLTEDDDVWTNREVDITIGPTSATKASRPTLAARSAAADDDVVEVPMTIVLDSDDEEGYAPSNFGYQTDETDSDGHGSSDENSFDDTFSSKHNVDTGCHSVSPEIAQAFQMESEQILCDTITSGDEIECDPASPVPESIISENGEVDSDLDLSDAEREGMQAFYDLYETGNTKLLIETRTDGKKPPEYYSVTKNFTHGSNAQERLACENLIREDGSKESLSFEYSSKHSLDQPSSIRQPSPSDAAMVKTTVAPTSMPVPVHHLPSDDWKEYAARTLQDLTNRRTNKAGYDFEPNPRPMQQTISLAERLYPQITSDEEPKSMDLDELYPVASRPQVMADRVEHPSIALGKALRPTTPLSFTENNAEEEFVTDRQPSPFLDMTSAVRYNESKALMTGAIMDSTSPSRRSRLSIDAIIHNATTPEPEARKRKAEEISDVLESEVRAWGSSSPASLNPAIKSQNTTSEPQSLPQSEPGPATQESSESTNNTRDQPTMKRLKKVAEGAAYIALGGVGLFSILVATAPDFL